MNDSDAAYRALCSSETLRSGTKGFFRDFSESVIDEAGKIWIEKYFGNLKTDEERVTTVLTDSKVRNIVLDTLKRMKHLYRDKDAKLSRSKRLEGLEMAATGNHEKALLLFSQAVLRAPATGKCPAIDQGFTLPLGLLARADTLMALNDYDFALEDLKLAAEEDLPQTARLQLVEKIEECSRLLVESGKSLVPCGSPAASNQLKKQFKTPKPPSLTDGPNSSEKLFGTSKLVDIRETPEAGKHAVAAATIRPGDVLAVEPPLASCLLPQFYGTHCQHCLSRLRAPVGCPLCSSVAFCGRKCRDQAVATYHKFECKILALLIGSGMSLLSTLALRMVTQEGPERCRRICKKLHDQNLSSNKNPSISDDDNPVTRVDDDNLSKSAKRRLRKKKLRENLSHKGEEDGMTTNAKLDAMEERELDTRAYDLVTLATKRSAKDFLERTVMAVFLLKGLQTVKFFDKPSMIDEPPTDDEIKIGALLLRNLQLLQFNAHEIFETRLADDHRFRGNKTVYVGIAIYPSVARFNHDCYPAVTRYYAGRNIVIVALRPLQPGDVIAENYGPIFTKKTAKERRRSLAGRYWFRCDCRACTEDWPDFDNLMNQNPRLRCPTDGCPGLLSQPRKKERPMKCSKCLKTKNLEESMRILSDCETDYTRGLDAMEANKPEDAIVIIGKALEKFHRVAAAPHRETHLAEIAFAGCFADFGNTWRPIK